MITATTPTLALLCHRTQPVMSVSQQLLTNQRLRLLAYSFQPHSQFQIRIIVNHLCICPIVLNLSLEIVRVDTQVIFISSFSPSLSLLILYPNFIDGFSRRASFCLPWDIASNATGSELFIGLSICLYCALSILCNNVFLFVCVCFFVDQLIMATVASGVLVLKKVLSQQ